MTPISPGDICLCTHTHEVHFGHECSEVGCPCKQFALIDAGVEIFEALTAAQQEFIGLIAYLETCSPDVIIDNLPGTVMALEKKREQAQAAIRKAKGE